MLKNFVKGIADAIRRKEGSTDLISPMDFAQRIDNLQVGGGTDGVEEKAGMTYVTKEALFTIMDSPTPDSMTQAELKNVLISFFHTFPISGMKKTNGIIYPFGMILGEEIDESRFTYAEWEATAIDWDAIKTTSSGNIPTWRVIAQEIGSNTMDAFKEFIHQMFPQQLTETEFFGDTTT